jgi:hypothetical protein
MLKTILNIGDEIKNLRKNINSRPQDFRTSGLPDFRTFSKDFRTFSKDFRTFSKDFRTPGLPDFRTR